MLQRKRMIQYAMLFGVAAVTALALLLSGPNGAKAAPDHITLTWASDPKTTQTVTWRTEVAAKPGLVQYAQVKNGFVLPAKSYTAQAQAEELASNAGIMSIHSVTLTGLLPGSRYLYRVGDGEDWGEINSFTTAPARPEKFKFLLFGDSQSYTYELWQKTLHQAYRANQDAAFLVNVGDLVDVGQDYGQWNGWLNAGRGVIDSIPVVPVVGNHETYTPEAKFSLPTLFTAQLKVPSNGPEGLKGQVYSFDYGNVHFSVLDSQLGEERSFVANMLELQKSWLEQDLASSAKQWKVVLIHRPPYHNRPKPGDEELRDGLTPLLDKHHVDVVFAGHDHDYVRSYPLYDGQIMQNPAQGTIYVTCGRSGTKTYKATLAKEWNEFFFNPIDEPNYMTVEVNGGELSVKSFMQSGALIDAWTVSKGK